MALFSEGGITSPDIYIGVSCITATVICTVLNFLVFLHNYHKRSSVARNLFLCLSAADLLTAWVILVPYSVQAFKERDEECQGMTSKSCGKEYYMKYSEASLLNKLQSIVSYAMVIASCHITAFMAITRYCQIKHPFQPLKSKYILTAAFLSIVWGPIVLACTYLHEISLEKNKLYRINLQQVFLASDLPQFFGIQFTWTDYTILVCGGTAILQIISILISLMTIFELIKSVIKPAAEGGSRCNRKSTVRILVTNFGSFLTLMVWLVGTIRGYEDDKRKIPFDKCLNLFFSLVIVPSILSTINPIIYILFTNGWSLKLTVSSDRR